MKFYQVDAFTKQVFKGNPAAVVPLNSWLETSQMQAIALENNLSETAFFVLEGEIYHIRWFTPLAEVNLCGHATLATAFVIFKYLNFKGETIRFQSKSGELTVKKEADWYFLNFPAKTCKEASSPKNLLESFNTKPLKVLKEEDDFLLIFESEEQVKNLKPNFSLLGSVECRGIIAAAPCQEENFDIVSRFFAPKVGVNEDPVTGSSYSILIPYFAKELNKQKINAKQISSRSGIIKGQLLKNRVLIGGQAILFAKGEFFI